jgi:hypothetical protein
MNSVLSFFAAPLIAIQLVMLSAPAEVSCKKADLVVKEIWPPDYVEDIGGTSFEVVIKNTGKLKSEPTTLKAFDLDISYEEAEKSIKNKETLELIAENNGRAKDYVENKYAEVDENKFDYDHYWEVTEKIGSLKPNEEVRITISIKDHWIYDSNCEIRVIVDPKNKVDECDVDNNQLDFFGWG